MLLNDSQHIKPLVVTVLIGAAAVAWYVLDVPNHLRGPSGSTAVGITLGVVAFLIMLFLAALGLKRRVPHWRLGRASTWLRWHIWLGLLLPLLVALHGAFRTGGTMTTLLWLVLGAVWISGIAGLILQQFIPSLLLHAAPNETVAQQWQREMDNLLIAAEGVVEQDQRGRMRVQAPGVVLNYVGSNMNTAAPPWAGEPGSAFSAADLAALVKKNEPVPGAEPLRTFYLQHARPFLLGKNAGDLANRTRAASMFESIRQVTPPHVHRGVSELEALCDRRRQLILQRLLMRTLMWWLFVHVPLSWALIALTAAHAVIALRYM